ncbi:MAG TPA: SIMPL domain-containing protein [Candidatus Eisenbergiella merdipullorum]|uniref:SIMPL domain-containing protein n=1 Tax=Candidatus Eisenbergiella merdipullorum TaxID=2838553 RepID=A0A9D2I6R7_9FIRM|nr:SIMPL domain-containing protein [Candidatus Eisenbergiella merdipullorum]
MKKKITVLLFCTLLLLSACQPESTAENTPAGETARSVTVNSTEQVSVVPDIAEIVYSIQTRDSDAQTCQEENSATTDQVVALLKQLGVAETSIRTTGYYLDPVYDWSGSMQVLTGYEAVTTLTVSDLPMDQVGDILTQSVDAGINNIQSVSYLSSEYDEAYQEALSLAVAAARTKANALAQAEGYAVGEILSIQETSGYSEARYNDTALLARTEASSMADSVSIMPGELDVKASVVVEFSIQTADSADS